VNTLEQLGLWYLRLNGYFTMPNFIAHCHDGARTDVDVLGVRFPDSSEYPDDAARLCFPRDKIDVVLAEVKSGECKLNGPWKGESDKQPLEYVLKRVGLFDSEALVGKVANALYSQRHFPPQEESARWPFIVRIVCFGQTKNRGLHGVTQILWSDAISFMADRFQRYRGDKADHSYWDSFGKFLWDKLTDEGLPNVDQIDADWRTKCKCWP
jgi:hypothetical protein